MPGVVCITGYPCSGKSTLAKHEVEDLTHIIRQYYIVKFHRRRTPKYGTINKGFTEEQLQRFFRAVNDPKFRLLFGFQA